MIAPDGSPRTVKCWEKIKTKQVNAAGVVVDALLSISFRIFLALYSYFLIIHQFHVT
jgi:hypothetical protein